MLKILTLLIFALSMNFAFYLYLYIRRLEKKQRLNNNLYNLNIVL